MLPNRPKFKVNTKESIRAEERTNSNKSRSPVSKAKIAKLIRFELWIGGDKPKMVPSMMLRLKTKPKQDRPTSSKDDAVRDQLLRNTEKLR